MSLHKCKKCGSEKPAEEMAARKGKVTEICKECRSAALSVPRKRGGWRPRRSQSGGRIAAPQIRWSSVIPVMGSVPSSTRTETFRSPNAIPVARTT